MAQVIKGQQVDKFRLKVLVGALRLECMGMTRGGRSVYSIVKSEFGFKGSKESVLKQLMAHIESQGE